MSSLPWEGIRTKRFVSNVSLCAGFDICVGYGFGGGGAFLSMDAAPAGSAEQPPSPSIQPAYSDKYAGQELGPRPQFFGSKTDCARCGAPVYHAEEIVAAGSKWHKPCFRCGDCRAGLDMTKYADNNGEVYCRSCHAKRFGLKVSYFSIYV